MDLSVKNQYNRRLSWQKINESEDESIREKQRRKAGRMNKSDKGGQYRSGNVELGDEKVRWYNART